MKTTFVTPARVLMGLTLAMASLVAGCGDDDDGASSGADALNGYLATLDKLSTAVCDCYQTYGVYPTKADCEKKFIATPSQKTCFQDVYDRNASTMASTVSCQTDNNSQFATCLDPIDCSDSTAINACIASAKSRQEACPKYSTAVENELDACNK